jgi:hypothetical protein
MRFKTRHCAWRTSSNERRKCLAARPHEIIQAVFNDHATFIATDSFQDIDDRTSTLFLNGCGEPLAFDH